MTILSDLTLLKLVEEKTLKIDTSDKYCIESQIGPCSIDFRLSGFIKLCDGDDYIIDPKSQFQDYITPINLIDEDEGYILKPGRFILGSTIEKVTLPLDLCAKCEGRSSLGRLGIMIHTTAGFIDSGFSGTITLEICNIGYRPVILYEGMRICQLVFHKLDRVCGTGYGDLEFSKYQNQVFPTDSKIHLDHDLKN